MTRPLLRNLLLMVLSLMATRAFAESAPPSGEPFELVRNLQSVQDGIANGDAAAHGSHLALIRQIGEKFLAADPGVWSNPQNGQAVVIYLLSGGAPQIVRKLPRDKINVDKALFDGALAYVEGRQDEARDLFKDVKPRTIPSGMGGQVALVQGALFARSEASLAIERLDDARLLLPGTLVEEAALRREILLVGQAEDFDKFEFLTLAYIRHYRNSVYAGDFWQRFSTGLTQSSLALDDRRFARIAGAAGTGRSCQPPQTLPGDRARSVDPRQARRRQARERASADAQRRHDGRPRACSLLSRCIPRAH